VSQSVTENELNRTPSSTDLYQTCHHGSDPGGVITYCFWWKLGILMSVKPEVELIFTIAIVDKYA